MVITLIGYRGTGKTTVAQQLAQHLKWNWVDADSVIEERAGKSIHQIFADDGEPTFRQLEQTVMEELLQQERTVIASGGGAVTSSATRAALASPDRFVIWLNAKAETVHSRIEGDASTADRRPNLTTAGGLEEIEQLLSQRRPLYKGCADITVETDNQTIDQIVAEIIPQLPIAFRTLTNQPGDDAE